MIPSPLPIAVPFDASSSCTLALIDPATVGVYVTTSDRLLFCPASSPAIEPLVPIVPTPLLVTVPKLAFSASENAPATAVLVSDTVLVIGPPPTSTLPRLKSAALLIVATARL